MPQNLIPDFNFHNIFITPWAEFTSSTLIITLMGFFVAASCGLIGVFLILRKMALIGDAISHSLLPGIALAFLITGTRSTSPLFLGAILVGILTVVLIEFIHQNSLIKPDAAIGTVFSSLFAIGVILITLFADHIDLDTECVLYGEIAFVPLEQPVSIAGLSIAPYPLFRMALIFFSLITLISLFFKELLLTTFDPGLARTLGFKPKTFHYTFTIILSIVIVSAFKSVGAILVVAMLLFPGATALLISKKLRSVLFLVPLFAALYAFLGFHLASYLDASIAASMSTIALFTFLLIWSFSSLLSPQKNPSH